MKDNILIVGLIFLVIVLSFGSYLLAKQINWHFSYKHKVAEVVEPLEARIAALEEFHTNDLNLVDIP